MSHMPTSVVPALPLGVISGAGAPVGAPSAGTGTLYINTDNGDVYRWSGSAWVFLANLRGPTGAAGSGGGSALLLDVTNPPSGSGLTAADKTGVADSRAALQAAVEYAAANGYGGIYLPAGDYQVTRSAVAGTTAYTTLSSIDIWRSGGTAVTDFVIAGAGPGATRIYGPNPGASDWYLIRIRNGAENVTVRDLTLDGMYVDATSNPGVTEQHHLIRIGGTSNNAFNNYVKRVQILNCHLKRCRGDAINITGENQLNATLTLTGNLADGDTVTIGAITYTIKAALTPAANEVQRGASTSATIDNLRRAILDIGVEGAGGNYGTGTTVNTAVGSVTTTSTTLRVASATPTAVAVAETSGNASWDYTSTTNVNCLTDELQVQNCNIYETSRTGIGVQRGCRRVIINGCIIHPSRRGVLDFEPTGLSISEPNGGLEGNAPQQFIITNNILIRGTRNNTVATLWGQGTDDRNDYSVFANNLCVNGGVDVYSAGPMIIANNVIRGNTLSGGDPVGLIKVWRCKDLVISGNYIERPVPEEGETVANGTLEFRLDDATSPAQPLNNETVTIGVKTYTFKTTLTGAANEVFIGADLPTTIQNLIYAILDTGAPYEGVNYGNGTTANAAITSATSDGEYTLYVQGPSASTVTTETLTNGHWGTSSLSSSAGPCIEIIESNSVTSSRINIVGNTIRQHMPSAGINCTSVSHLTVSANQIHCFHSVADTGCAIKNDALSASDEIHVKNNHIYTWGTGTWSNGVRFATAASTAYTSVVGNRIQGCVKGVEYVGTPTQIPLIADNDISGNTGAAIVLTGTPFMMSGSRGSVAQYVGSGAPTHSAAKFSTYFRTNGTAGTAGAPGTARYLNTDGATTWAALIDS